MSPTTEEAPSYRPAGLVIGCLDSIYSFAHSSNLPAVRKVYSLAFPFAKSLIAAFANWVYFLAGAVWCVGTFILISTLLGSVLGSALCTGGSTLVGCPAGIAFCEAVFCGAVWAFTLSKQMRNARVRIRFRVFIVLGLFG